MWAGIRARASRSGVAMWVSLAPQWLRVCVGGYLDWEVAQKVGSMAELIPMILRRITRDGLWSSCIAWILQSGAVHLSSWWFVTCAISQSKCCELGIRTCIDGSHPVQLGLRLCCAMPCHALLCHAARQLASRIPKCGGSFWKSGTVRP